MFKKLFLQGESRPLTTMEDGASALFGGGISAVYISPLELMMVQQQRYGGSLGKTSHRIVQDFGVLGRGLGRGFVACVGRDSLYTLAFLSGTPLLQDAIVKRTGWHESAAGMAASVAAGGLCGAVSNPLDTIKSCMQGDVEHKTYGTFSETVATLRKERGWARLFQGVEWRCANIIGCCFLINEARGILGPIFFPGRA
jgi:solute carrier family 25 carnitine/acylcarnitine transporter 20/29